MKNSINIAWVCRDGYLDLFPLIEKELGKSIDLNSHIITHLKKDKIYLQEKYNFKNVEVLSESISRIIDQGFSTNQLDNLSKKYNKIPMIRMLWSTIFEESLSDSRIHDLAIAHIIFWENFIENTSIDFLVYERPSVLTSCIAWLVCQHHGVKSIDYVDTPLDTMTVVDNFNGDYAKKLISQYQDIRKKGSDYEGPSYKKAEEYFNKIISAPQKTNESILAGKMTNRRASIGFHRVVNLINLYRSRPKQKEYYLYDKSFFHQIVGNILYISRFFFHRFINIFSKVANKSSEQYFLYPLFMKGEFSNHIFMNPGYQDPISEIKRISMCLPPKHYLYVKEHYSGYPDRHLIDLFKIKRIRNVKLISPKEDPFLLVQNAKGIITSGSTMGFEAMMLSKVVILTGDPWYRYLPGIIRASKVEEISDALDNIDNFLFPSHSEKISILQALFSISSAGIKMPREGTLDQDNVKNMTQILLEYIEDNNDV